MTGGHLVIREGSRVGAEIALDAQVWIGRGDSVDLGRRSGVAEVYGLIEFAGLQDCLIGHAERGGSVIKSRPLPAT